jgi:hypothetical protein
VTLKYNSAGTQQWAVMYDGNGNDYYDPRTDILNGFDSPSGMAMDNSGNIIVTGSSYTTTGQFSSQDMTTIKYSPAGTAVWVKTYDSPAHGMDQAKAITSDASSNVYITGKVDATTIKYNSSGTLQWVINYSGGSMNNIKIDINGNVFAGGSIPGSSLLIKYSQSNPLYLSNKQINHSEITTNSLKVYPNPVQSFLRIENDNNKMLGMLTIYDASGKIVYQKFAGNSQMLIDVQHFSAGVYYIRSDQFSAAIKFVKE